MSNIQAERDALLLYALRHPPSNVKIVLPANATLEKLNLSKCNSPMEVFEKAESKRGDSFVFEVSKQACSGDFNQSDITYEGGSKGGVERPKSEKSRRPTETTPTAAPPAEDEGDTGAKPAEPSGGIFSNWMNFFSRTGASSNGNKKGNSTSGLAKIEKKIRVILDPKRNANNASSSTNNSNQDAQSTHETQRIPLFGTTGGTLADNVDSLIKDVERRPLLMSEFPHLANILLCPVFDEQALVYVHNGNFSLTVYEHILLAAHLLLGYRKSDFEYEIFNVFRPIFGITEGEHMNCLDNLMTPQLKELALRGDAQDEVARYVENIQLSDSYLLQLIECSKDEDFKLRFSALREISMNGADTGCAVGFTSYPLVVRCSIFAGVLCPIYLMDSKRSASRINPNHIFHTIEAVRHFLRIPSSLEKFCHLHSRLLANGECSAVDDQCRSVMEIVRAVNELDTSNLANEALSPSVKYCYYILQETLSFSMTPLPWLDAIDENTIINATALFIETSSALPPHFLSAFVMVDGRPLVSPRSTNAVFLYAAMSVFISVTVVRKLSAMQNCLCELKSSLNTLFIEIEPTMEATRKYCEMLVGSIPNTYSLLTLTKTILGSYLLGLHWNVTDPSTLQKMDIPSDFHEGIGRFFNFLLDDLSQTESNDPQMLLMLKSSVQWSLQDIGKLLQRNDEEFSQERSKKVAAAIPFPWKENDDHNPDQVIQHLVREEVCCPLPPPLASSPEQLYTKRVNDWAKIMLQIFKNLALNAPKGEKDSSRPSIYIKYNLLKSYTKLTRPSLNSLIKRLNTISAIQQECAMYYGRVTKEFEKVISVTGASLPPLVDVWKRVDKMSADIIDNIAEWTGVCVLLDSDAHTLLSTKYMITDQKAYQVAKKKSKTALLHYPKLHPDVTIPVIVREVDKTLRNTTKLLQKQSMSVEIAHHTCCFLAAELFGVYVETKEVYLTPQDVPDLLSDLDVVSDFFTQVIEPHEKKGNDKLELSINDNDSARSILEELRRIVTFVMTQASSDLISGCDGAPQFNSLPEFTSQSPWCKYIVRNVLGHRRDKHAKQFSY